MAYEGSEATDRSQIMADILSTIEKDKEVVEEALLHEIPEEMRDEEKLRLKKAFGLFECVSLLVGTVFGLGIFTSSSIAVRSVGNLPITMILWACYGLFASFGAITYGVLAHDIPSSGGDYAYILQFYGPLAGFLHQIAINLFIGPVFRAFLAVSISLSILRIFSGKKISLDTDTNLDQVALYIGAVFLGIFAIMLTTTLCCLSTRLVSQLSQVFLGFKLVTLVLIMAIGAYAYGKAPEILHNNLNYLGVSPSICNNGTAITASNEQENLFGVMEAVYAIAFSYQGWNACNYITEEVKVPTKPLQKGIWLSMPLIIFSYLVLLASYTSSLTTYELKETDFTSMKLFKKWVKVDEIQWIMPLLIGICIFATLLNYTILLSRVPVVGARHGHIPKLFSLLHITRITPIPSLVSQSLAAIFYTPFGFVDGFRLLVGAALYLEILFSAFVIVGFIIWKLKNSSGPCPFQVPLMIHVAYLILALCILILPFASADWTFKNFPCSWPKIVALFATFFVVLIIGLLTYYICVNKSQEGCCQSQDNLIQKIYQKVFRLAEENHAKDTLLLEAHGEKGDVSSFSNISLETQTLNTTF